MEASETDRKRAEEALRGAQEELVRKEKLAVLGQLAGAMAHELRNPLGAIKSSAFFLDMAVEDIDSEVKETLEILEKEVGTREGATRRFEIHSEPNLPLDGIM